MRYILSRKKPASARIKELLSRESLQGLDTDAPYNAFEQKVNNNFKKLVELINKIKNDNKRIMGYGATAKSAIVLNACRLGPDQIDAITDTTPIKQGRLTPGSHIPVVPHSDFVANKPDYALLFAWNHAEEIYKKETKFQESGGRRINYIPDVKVT